jgi:hypothetical protein
MRTISRDIKRGLGFFAGEPGFVITLGGAGRLGMLELRPQGPGFGVRLVRWAMMLMTLDIMTVMLLE